MHLPKFCGWFLFDDYLVLTFNYKDGTKTISLAEVESSDLDIDGVPVKAACSQEQAAFCNSFAGLERRKEIWRPSWRPFGR